MLRASASQFGGNRRPGSNRQGREREKVTPNRKSLVSIVTWLVGISLCVLFVGLLLPFDGPPGHQWVLPIGIQGFLFFSFGCCVILIATYFLDRFFTRK
jgi:hypothetical protein